MNKFYYRLKNSATKISLIILIGILYTACNSVRRVPKSKLLLTKNEITIDGKVSKSDTISELLFQTPNSSILGYHFRLNLYNLAKKNPDSSYKAMFIANPEKYKRQSRLLSAKQVERKGQSFLYSGIHNFLKKTGEAPVILEKTLAERSVTKLKLYYFNNGYFRSKIAYKIDTLGQQKAKIKYTIQKGNIAILDSIETEIASPALDSLFQSTSKASLIKPGIPYRNEVFDAERNRITTQFRNRGAYDFQQSHITYEVDTVGTGNKANVKLIINDQNVRDGDSTTTKPFKLYKISAVNLYTDVPKDKTQTKITDSTTYKNFKLYSYNKLKYRPRALTDAVFIAPGTYYSDIRHNLTNRYLNNLKIFNYPSITYTIDPKDSLKSSLIVNIRLHPKEKYGFGYDLNLTHSNIQNVGVAASTSLLIRNVFNGAETFEIATRGSIGSSKDLANPNDVFFNISEYGLDLKLNFPRLLVPFIKTEKFVPKSMIPSTVSSLGFSKQQNIGLDKENFTGAWTYNWTPKANSSSRFDLFNVQYVNNVNVNNYYNVYSSSYNALNNLAKTYNTNTNYVDGNGDLLIPSGTSSFTNDALNATFALPEAEFKTIRSIEERRKRLTENNLILASSFTFFKTSKLGLTDNTFYSLRTKLESAGNVLSLFAAATQTIDGQQSKKKIFDIEYSQYIKAETEFIKHWKLSRDKVLAMKGFIGIAIPYGNSANIPFSRSYFAGGSNDIRAWQPYSLGPGSSGAINDFNEANLKFTASAEFRFKIISAWKGALFIDTGNIWNVFDNITDKPSIFGGISSLKDIAVGSGFGVRYDLSFFVVRVDMGFKTYNPSSDETEKKWFRDYNFAHSVLNIGINYPF